MPENYVRATTREVIRFYAETTEQRARRSQERLNAVLLLSAAENSMLHAALRDLAAADEWSGVERLAAAGKDAWEITAFVVSRLGRLGSASTNPLQAIVDSARASALAEALDVLTGPQAVTP